MDDITKVAAAELTPVNDPALVPLQRTLAAAAAAPVATKSFAPPATYSSQGTISDMTKIMQKVRDFTLERIDAAILRLQNLRASVEESYRSNEEAIVQYVRLVEDGLRDIDRTDNAVDAINEATSR